VDYRTQKKVNEWAVPVCIFLLIAVIALTAAKSEEQPTEAPATSVVCNGKEEMPSINTHAAQDCLPLFE
jgi:ABC-type oligopeptide transport system substrate-binding subunit